MPLFQNEHSLIVVGSVVFGLFIFLLLSKWILRVLFGMIIIPEDKIGLVTKKFTLKGKRLTDGRIVALEGEAGYQIDPLSSGLHWGYFPWKYSINLQDFIVIGMHQIGLVSAKDGVSIPTGRILARHVESNNFQNARSFINNGGQKGKQVSFLNTGTYKINTLLFNVEMASIVQIEEGQLGVVTTEDGESITDGQIAGKPIEGHNNFQNFDKFLEQGGQRGLQTQFILAGSYTINPWAVSISTEPMTEIPIGSVGVLISYVGEDGVDQSGEQFLHGSIVKKGQKGVCITPLDPGRYPINTFTTNVKVVPTTNLVLNWANTKSESHRLDANLCTITVRSKDGFTFNLDVSQIIHIPSSEAPKVIARFGSVENLVSQVLEPTIGNYFRNSAQDSDVIEFLSSRQERQKAAKDKISDALKEYNVNAVDTLIGDIVPPADLMKTLTDRKIASEQQTTYQTQMESQVIKQELEKQTAITEMQAEIVKSTQGIAIAENEAEANVKKANGDRDALKANADGISYKIKTEADGEASKITAMGTAEAGKILAVGQATAKSYQQQAEAMGKDNFGKFKITEAIGEGHIEVMPKILITGSGGEGSTNSAITSLLGFKLLDSIDASNSNQSEEKITK